MDNRFQLDLTAMLHRLPRVYIELLIVSTQFAPGGSVTSATLRRGVATSHVQQLRVSAAALSTDPLKFPALYLLSAGGV